MTMSADRTTIELGTKRPERVVVTDTSGASIDPAACRLLGDSVELIDASSLATGSTPSELLVVFDLRRRPDLPDPGTYPIVLSLPDPSSPDPVTLLPLEVELVEDRSCLALAGARPTLTIDPSGAATLRLTLYNRCGHSISVDLRLSCDGETLGIEPSISIGASSTVDVEVGVALGDALDDLRQGRLPDDLRVVVSTSGDAGSIELELRGEDLVIDDRAAGADPAEQPGHRDPRPTDPPRPTPPPPSPRPSDRPPRSDPAPAPRPSVVGRILLWCGAVVIIVGGLALLGRLVGGGDDPGSDDDEEAIEQVEGPSTENEDDEAGEEEDGGQDEGDDEEQEGDEEDDEEADIVVGAYTGLTEAAARSQASGDGLDPTVRAVTTDDEDDDGLVLTQEPAAGSEVESGSLVTLTVGRYEPPPPPDTVLVGTYVGSTADVARTSAAGDGLVPIEDEVATIDSDLDGLVVDQRPAPGADVDPGSTVTLVIARFDGTVVPDVVGLESWRAIDLLNDLQRAAGETQPGYKDDRTCGPPGGGIVTAQEPAAGTPITGPFDVFVAVSVTCKPVPNLVDPRLTVAEADAIGREWLGEGRTFGFNTGCPARDGDEADSRRVERTEPPAGDVAPSFRIICQPVIR